VCYGWGAQTEDRATLESDLSADLGGYTAGQGLRTLPFCVPARLAARKAINSPSLSVVLIVNLTIHEIRYRG
jgi:hypothetical protein